MRRFALLRTCCSLLLTLTFASGAQAATYYVRNGGNDNADGKSHSTAWATINKVNGHAFSTGDSVLFHEGHVFTDTPLTVDWGGTSSQRAVIGAYHVQDGTEKRGLVNERPRFDGEDQRPSSRYGHLLEVTGDHVRVENLAVVNSEGRGVVFDEANFGQIANVYTSNTYDSGIRFIASNDAVIEGNYITDAARSWPEDGQTLGSNVRWASAIVVHDGSYRAVIKRNVVWNVFGEGINAHHDAADVLIEDNFVFGARAIGIYADASPRPTIRRNIVVGTSDSKYWRHANAVGAGIALGNELFHYEGSSGLAASVQTKNAKIYNNLVASTQVGVAIWGQTSSTFDNTLIYNNTLVDNQTQFSVLSGRPMPGSRFVNNILYSATSGTKDVNGAPSGLTATNNYFSQGDPGAPFSNAGNRYNGLQLARMTGWRAIKDRAQVSWRDFAPAAVSMTNSAGISIAALASVDLFNVDFNSKPHNNPFDMGAVGKGSGKVPKGPTLNSEAQVP